MLSKSATRDNIEGYDWYVYKGKGRGFEVRHRNTRRVLQEGDEYAIRFGTRSQSSRAFLIFKDNVKNDYGITEKEAQNLIKKSEQLRKPRNLIDLLDESKNKRVRTQGYGNKFTPSEAWDAPRYRRGGRLPSPKNHGYDSKNFQWRSVAIPTLTVFKTRTIKHSFLKGEWIGLRFDSESRGGYIVDTRGIIFRISPEVYDDIVENTILVEKNKWPEFSFTAEQVEQLGEERMRDTKAANKARRERATKQRAELNAQRAQQRIEERRARIKEEEELRQKGKEAKVQERLKKSRKHLGLDHTKDQAFDEFLRGNILDDVEDNIDFDLGDENSDIGSELPEDELDFDKDRETGDEAEPEEDAEEGSEEDEEPADFEQEDAEEDVMTRDDDTNQDLMDDLDDEINKTRDALEDSIGDEEDLDLEDDEDLDDEDEDEPDEDEEDDFGDEDDDFDPEDDETGEDESEPDEDETGDEGVDGEDDDDFDPEDDEGDVEDDSTDADDTGDDEESEDPEEETDEGDDDTDADEDEDASGENEDDTDEEDGVDSNEDDAEGDADSKEEKEVKKVEVGDVVTFNADEVKQRQFLVFEIVPGKKNPNVTNYLLFNLKGDGKTYSIFRSSDKAKTNIEQSTSVLRRATGSELRKVFKMANNLSLDRRPIIS